MSYSIDDLRPSGAERFAVAGRCLLPNEGIRFVCQTLGGFLVLTDRRIVFLREDVRLQYAIERVIPCDCIQDIQQEKADLAKIIGVALDRYGRHTAETVGIDIRAPRALSGENKTDVKHHFQTTIGHCLEVVEEVRSDKVFSGAAPSVRDYSHLSTMPASLTRDALLDLNTILRDQPVPDELVPEAMKFLGSDPFILEESLRDGNDSENGVLFAAGNGGYYWIQGKKQGRFMSNVIVDTVEWENVLCFAHQWQNKGAKIHATYTLTKDGRESQTQYQWRPVLNEDTVCLQWLLQPSNGPWILADILYKYHGRPMPASWGHDKELRPDVKRYYH